MTVNMVCNVNMEICFRDETPARISRDSIDSKSVMGDLMGSFASYAQKEKEILMMSAND